MKQILFLLAAVLLLGGCAEEKKTDVRWATFNVRYDNPQDSLNNWAIEYFLEYIMAPCPSVPTHSTPCRESL